MRCIFSQGLNESTLHVFPGPARQQGAAADQSRARLFVLKDRIRPAFDDLIATFFPADCRTCGGPLAHAASVPVCENCRSRITAQSMAMCRCCSEALDIELDGESMRLAGQLPTEGLLCNVCRLAPPMFERAVAHAVYETEVRDMLHLLKYERMRPMAGPLGKMLAAAILTLEPAIAQDVVVVPVPLFSGKRNRRGYNHADLLAEAAIVELRRLRPVWRLRRLPDVLERRRDTKSQYELSPRGRRRNVEGAFGVVPNSVPVGCEALLIDDIYTTGATARECARVLRRSGAAKVWVATLARAQTPRVAVWDETLRTGPRQFG